MNYDYPLVFNKMLIHSTNETSFFSYKNFLLKNKLIYELLSFVFV